MQVLHEHQAQVKRVLNDTKGSPISSGSGNLMKVEQLRTARVCVWGGQLLKRNTHDPSDVLMF